MSALSQTATILGLALFCAMPVSAQTPEDAIDRFVTACSAVREDPNAYLAALPETGPAGEPVTTRSPDETIASVFYRQDNLYDEVVIAMLGDRHLSDCAVIAELYDFDTKELAAQVETIIADRGWDLDGGDVPLSVSDGGQAYLIENHLYALSGLWPDTGEIALVFVFEGELQLMVQFSD